MSSKLIIRGPYPPNPARLGFQNYYVDDNIAEARKVMFYFRAGKLSDASCSCTDLASLDDPCTHLEAVLRFIETARSQPSPRGAATLITPPSTQPLKHSVRKPDPDQQFAPPRVGASFAEIVPSVLCAVQDEVTAIQTSSNVRQVHLTNGVLRGGIAGSYVYRFDLEDDLRSPADTPVQLCLDNGLLSVSGTVVRCEPDKFIEVALDQPLGEIIPQATLESRLDFIWQAAAKRIQEYQSSGSRILIDAFLKPSAESLFDSALNEDWGEFPPDDEQRKALKEAVSHRVFFVHGPPGTGKSVTIGWLVKELVQRGERVMIASHTNIAVDNALSKALENQAIQEIHARGRILRLGEPIDEKLKEIRLPEVIARISAELQKRFKELQERHAAVASKLSTADQEIRILQSHMLLATQFSLQQNRLNSLDKHLEVLEHEVQAAKSNLDTLEKQRLVYSLGDLLLWIPRAYRRNQATAKFEEKVAQLETARQEKQELTKQIAQTTLKLQNAQLPLQVSEFEQGLNHATQEKYRLQSELDDLNRQMLEVHKQIDEVAKNVLANVQVIGATLSKICMTPALENFHCDALIVDELSTAPFPFVLVALGLAGKRAVLFGDPRQLPPICVSQEAPAKYWLERDTYEIVPQHEFVSRRLTLQRRMPESVVELVNHRMYEGKLRTPELTKQDKDKDLHHPPFEGGNVIFVDTSTLNPWCAWDTNYSRYNLYSAEIVSEIVSKEIRPAIKVQKVANVGVIAPYRAQKKLIRKICESKFDKEKVQKFIEFHTVDAFQGQERDVIVIDLTAGPPLPPGLRLSEQEEREKNPQHERSVSKVSRLLNVAITRTKKKLIIVGNKEYFERHLANGEFVLEVIELATRGWHQPPGTSVLQLAVAAEHEQRFYKWIDGEDFLRYDAELGGSSRFLDATSFYVHLRQDFQRCKTSAVIISPFVTLNRVGDLRPDILSMLKRGVKVTVVTKPLREAEFGRDALKQLESWGCDIKQRSRTHEKVVLIDDKIGYYGSLNTLSHKDTKELMFRFEGEEVSSLLCQFTGVLGPVVIPRHRQIAADAGTRRLSRDECRGKLKHLRFKIATQRHIPFYAPLYNQTIEALLDNPPTTEEELVEALMLNGEKQLKHLTPFLDEILSILGRYNP